MVYSYGYIAFLVAAVLNIQKASISPNIHQYHCNIYFMPYATLSKPLHSTSPDLSLHVPLSLVYPKPHSTCKFLLFITGERKGLKEDCA